MEAPENWSPQIGGARVKRPSFQFYPSDWSSNANLRRCSPAARGVWMDCLCLFHDSDEYGLVRWTLKEIARAIGASMSHVKELVDKCVLKGSDTEVTDAYIYTPRTGRRDGEPVTLVPIQKGPLWYSSRMVRDEYVRTIRGAWSRFGEDENSISDAPKRSPKPTLSDGPSAFTSSPSSASPSGISAPLPDPLPNKNKNLKNGFYRENGVGNGGVGAVTIEAGIAEKPVTGEGRIARSPRKSGGVTIEDPVDRLARFQQSLAQRIGPEGWDVVIAATKRSHPDHARSLAVCKRVAHDLGKGWPHRWPIE